jgi:hypothetical protein
MTLTTTTRSRGAFRGAQVCVVGTVLLAGLCGCEAGLSECDAAPPKPTVDLSPVEGPWPSNREKLVFLWENARCAAKAFSVDGKETVDLWPDFRKLATRDRNYVARLSGGAMVFDHPLRALYSPLEGATAVSVEMHATPAYHEQEGLVGMVSLASDTGAPRKAATSGSPDGEVNLSVSQRRDEIVLTLRTSTTGEKGAELCLGRVARSDASHIVVSYRDGLLVCYMNGVLAGKSEDVSGDLGNWSSLPLVFGVGTTPGSDWAGDIEGVAIYARFVDEAEARLNFRRYSAKTRARKQVPRLELQGKLLERSPVPEAKHIPPYTRALAVYEYEVEEVFAGEYAGKTVRVAHWGLLDSKVIPISERPTGESYRLVLELLEEDNPQLEGEWLSDTLTFDPDAVLYFDIQQSVGAEEK